VGAEGDWDAWERRALEVNEPRDLVDGLHAQSADVLHYDRHVLDVFEGPQPDLRQEDVRVRFCEIGLRLLRRWSEWRRREGHGLLVSEPVLIIDDEWLIGADHPAPPHVYICLATEARSFQAVEHEYAESRASTGNARLDAILPAAAILRRIEGAFEDEPGAWLVSLRPEGERAQ
jgi:hypothetical protein